MYFQCKLCLILPNQQLVVSTVRAQCQCFVCTQKPLTRMWIRNGDSMWCGKIGWLYDSMSEAQTFCSNLMLQAKFTDYSMPTIYSTVQQNQQYKLAGIRFSSDDEEYNMPYLSSLEGSIRYIWTSVGSKSKCITHVWCNCWQSEPFTDDIHVVTFSCLFHILACNYYGGNFLWICGLLWFNGSLWMPRHLLLIHRTMYSVKSHEWKAYVSLNTTLQTVHIFFLIWPYSTVEWVCEWSIYDGDNNILTVTLTKLCPFPPILLTMTTDCHYVTISPCLLKPKGEYTSWEIASFQSIHPTHHQSTNQSINNGTTINQPIHQ